MVAQSPEECGGASVPADPIVMQSSAPQKIPQELTTVLSATKNTTGPDSASTATQTKQENLKRTFVPLSSLVQEMDSSGAEQYAEWHEKKLSTRSGLMKP